MPTFEENHERRPATPEEMAEFTRQRRIDAGLPEISEIDPENLEQLEEQIATLLKILDQYDYSILNDEMQEEWYYAELEAEAGKDRELALLNLQDFLARLGPSQTEAE